MTDYKILKIIMNFWFWNKIQVTEYDLFFITKQCVQETMVKKDYITNKVASALPLIRTTEHSAIDVCIP